MKNKIFVIILSALLISCSTNTEPKEFSYSAIFDDQGFFENIDETEIVGNLEYASIKIPNTLLEVTDSEIKNTLESFYQYYIPEVSKTTNRKIFDGDTLNIDYVGSIDGVEFNGGSTAGTGTTVTIGVTAYIDDFLEQLIGHMPGEEVNVYVTFPDDYSEKDLQGKEALFVTQINYIEEEVIDDAYVKSNFKEIYGWATLDEMRTGIEEELRLSKAKDYLYGVILEMELDKDIPKSLITYQENVVLAYYQSYADSYGIELEEFLSTYAGYGSIKEMHDAENETNLSNIKFSLITLAIAKAEGLSVEDSDLISYFAKEIGVLDYSLYEEEYGLPYLKHIVLSEKVLEHLYKKIG